MTCLLKSSSIEIPLYDVEPTDWVKINMGTVGFYRTHYTNDMLEQFLPDIQNQNIPAVDR